MYALWTAKIKITLGERDLPQWRLRAVIRDREPIVLSGKLAIVVIVPAGKSGAQRR